MHLLRRPSLGPETVLAGPGVSICNLCLAGAIRVGPPASRPASQPLAPKVLASDRHGADAASAEGAWRRSAGSWEGPRACICTGWLGLGNEIFDDEYGV